MNRCSGSSTCLTPSHRSACRLRFPRVRHQWASLGECSAETPEREWNSGLSLRAPEHLREALVDGRYRTRLKEDPMGGEVVVPLDHREQ
jgi:hypothetical protein